MVFSSDLDRRGADLLVVFLTLCVAWQHGSASASAQRPEFQPLRA